MINFKEIAEKCLAGELSGTFVFQNGQKISSSKLQKYDKDPPYGDYPYYISHTCTLTNYGFGYNQNYNVIDFIPDNMAQKKIEIDIPEGKVPVMEQTEKGVVITWRKELTYNDIFNHLWEQHTQIGLLTPLVKNENTDKFNKKVDVLCKLTNIRNYFGKPDGTKAGYYIYKSTKERFQVAQTGYPCLYASDAVVFKEKEHAEQAIKMLGDELKYLFEPW